MSESNGNIQNSERLEMTPRKPITLRGHVCYSKRACIQYSVLLSLHESHVNKIINTKTTVHIGWHMRMFILKRI